MSLLATLFNSLTTGENAAPTYRSSASEVRLTFFATNETGQVVSNLTAQDFAVVDEGVVIRDFRSFSPTNITNVNVVILVDCSESVLRAFHKEMSGLLELISRTRWADGDEVSVIAFHDAGFTVLCGGTCLKQPTDALFSSLHPRGATPLYDALVSTADWLRRPGQPRVGSVVIVLSDGVDTISRNSALDAMQAMLASYARIYSLDLNSPSAAFRDIAALRNLADATGGRYFHLSDGAVKIISSVIDDQRASYALTYQLQSHKPGFHSVGIFPAHNLHLRFHSRRFYYYEDLKP
jgi:VWFA-related protein